MTLFERWLTLRDRDWRADEIEVFGALLHRCLFPEPVWSWIETTIREAGPGAGATGADLPGHAALCTSGCDPLGVPVPPSPWPRPRLVPRGGSATRPVPLRAAVHRRAPAPTAGDAADLVVVSQPRDRRLDDVDYADVVSAIQNWAASRGFPASVLHNPTAVELRAAIAQVPEQRPDIVHFMGHGRFDPRSARGSRPVPSGGRRRLGCRMRPSRMSSDEAWPHRASSSCTAATRVAPTTRRAWPASPRTSPARARPQWWPCSTR